MSSCRAQGMPTMQRSWASLTVTVHLPQRCKMGPTCSCNNTQSFVAHITSPFLQVRGNEKHLQSKQMGDMLGNVRLSQQEANFPVLCTSILGRPKATSKPVGAFMGQQGTERWCGRCRQVERTAREPTRPTLGWVTLGTGCVPGLGACPVNQDNDLPYSLFMCLDLVKVASWSPWLPYTWINTHQEKNNPFSPFSFFNLSLQIPNLFQEFFL